MNLEANLQIVRQEYLQRMTRGNGELLREVEGYVTGRNGKMLRPQMLLAAAATFGEDCLNSRRTLLLAVCVEMLHNASLLHDDVIDHADSRRSRPSVNAQWNNGVAVLVGDYHLAQIMNLLDEVNDHNATRLINQTVMEMVESELLAQEIDGKWQSTTMTAERYLRIIDGKTARLFATACALGNPDYEEYGLHYGRLFQLRDDQTDGEDNEFTADLIRQEEAALNALNHRLDFNIN